MIRFFCFTDNQADGRLIVRMAEHVIDGREVEIHLSRVLRLERRHLEVNHHEASKLQVVEKQIKFEVLSADLKQHLAPDKCKPQAEFDEKLTQVREKTLFEVALLCFRCESKEIEVVGILDELLCEIGLRLREGCLEVRQRFALPPVETAINLHDQHIPAPAILDRLLDVP